MRKVLLSPFIVVLLSCPNAAIGFAPPTCKTIAHRASCSVSTTTALGSSSREEEIAKLEEQLRQLKQEQQNDDAATEGGGGDGTAFSTTAEINQVEQRILEKVQGKDMILSEQDLYDGNIVQDQSSSSSTEEGGGSVVQNVLVAVLAVVFLVVFSQIPIGQEDLSKYSVSPTTSSSRTIDLGDLNTDVPRP